jgi:hypothetical protein
MPDVEDAAIARLRRLWEKGLASGAAQERLPLSEFLGAARARVAWRAGTQSTLNPGPKSDD